jgi:hypothetical protein
MINIKDLRSLFIFRVSQLLPSQPFCTVLHAVRMSVKRPLPLSPDLYFLVRTTIAPCPIALSLDESRTDCLSRAVPKFELTPYGGFALSWPSSERPKRSLHCQETTAGLCLACYVRSFRVLLLNVDCLTVITGMNTRRKSLQRVSDTLDYKTNGIFYSDFKTGHPVFAL